MVEVLRHQEVFEGTLPPSGCNKRMFVFKGRAYESSPSFKQRYNFPIQNRTRASADYEK